MAEIGYAKRSANYQLTGNALLAFPIPFDTGEEVLVPRLNRPCYLLGSAILIAQTPAVDVTVELAIAQAGFSQLPLDQVASAGHGPGLSAGSLISPWYRIPPGTPGRRYQLYMTCTGGGDVLALSPAHAPVQLVALA